MSDGAAVAAKLKEVDIITSNGDIHVTLEPTDDKHLIVDERGNAITTKKGLMTTLDAKFGKRIEISQGTMWFIGIAFVAIQVIFSYGGSLWSKSAEDSAVRTKVDAIQVTLQQQAGNDAKLQTEIEKLNDKFDALKDKLNDQAQKDQYKKGQIEGLTLQQGVK